MKLKHALTLLALSATAHGQLAVMHTNGVVVSPANVSVLRTSIGVPSTFGTGSNSVVGGGLSNAASGSNSAVVGGFSNTASGTAVISEGATLIEGRAFVGGGSLNNALGAASVVAGGGGNTVTEWASAIGGGNNNIISNRFSVIAGGLGNRIFGEGRESAIAGGYSNRVSNAHGFVGGGLFNVAGGVQSVVAGGAYNNASEAASTVVGGFSNTASGVNSTAAGSYAEAANQGAFVYSDNSSTNSFSSTNDNSFNIRAHGGVSLDLGTNGIAFRNTTNAAVTRTNLGLGGGVTTNISIVGTNNTNTLVFSNGILTSVQ
jgi:hypothetical protein